MALAVANYEAGISGNAQTVLSALFRHSIFFKKIRAVFFTPVQPRFSIDETKKPALSF